MKQLLDAGNSVDDFAKKLGIADDLVRAQTLSGALQKLMHTDKYRQYVTYLKFLSKPNKKKRPDLIYE
ncbi:WYL domain [Phytophthora infestans]|uniref:WYL domain n=1 Tax=Phytophthora infestans TaxID=4787 RepID=A0A833WFU5_PHYIN|nr:WYL domain [Phytophthora infestans]